MQKTSNSAFAAELPIRFQIGDDFKRVFKFWTDADKTIPLDITAKVFSIKVLTGGRSVLLDFDDYVITAPNILTIVKTYSEMNIQSNTFTWELKEIGETVFSIFWGPFFGVIDGGAPCLNNTQISTCMGTIDVIAVIPPSAISPDPITITGGVTENPLFIEISDYPGYDQYAEIIYKEGNDEDGYVRANDLQIQETYLADVFTGFLVTGHGIDTFENDGLLILKK